MELQVIEKNVIVAAYATQGGAIISGLIPHVSIKY